MLLFFLLFTFDVSPFAHEFGSLDGGGANGTHSFASALGSIRGVVYLVHMCNFTQRMSVADLWKRYHSPGTGSLQGLIEACSHGRASFAPDANPVFEIEVPCSGDTAGMNSAYDSLLACEKPEFVGWAEAASTNGSSSPPPHESLILVLPVMPRCPWKGLATIGCDVPELGRCVVWLNDPSSENVGLELHELGHNWGLDHSGSPDREYGDLSCAMGAVTQAPPRCFNPVKARKLGWADAASEVFDASTVAATFELPAMSEHPVNYVSVSTPAREVVIAISHRRATCGDESISPRFDGAITVHGFVAEHVISSRSEPDEADDAESVLLASMLDCNASYEDRWLGVRVARICSVDVTSYSSQSLRASVRVEWVERRRKVYH